MPWVNLVLKTLCRGTYSCFEKTTLAARGNRPCKRQSGSRETIQEAAAASQVKGDGALDQVQQWKWREAMGFTYVPEKAEFCSCLNIKREREGRV